MIITDQSVLRQMSRDTSIEECQASGIFEILDYELANSKTPGIGLTAIQIGTPIRVCIIRIPKQDKHEELKINMINPKIVEQYDEIIFPNEGCLSLPKIRVNTRRFDNSLIEWMDYDEKKIKRALFTGLESVCVSQEIDHCEGVLITDREYKIIKIGRNEPCHCGSGKKYKKCHLSIDK